MGTDLKPLSIAGLALLLGGLISAPALAEPFSGGNAETGKVLVEKNCVQCHVAQFGGDGSSVFTRSPRKINSAPALLAQIRTCNTMIGSKLFEDEELHVASYLNKTYYKFEK